MRKSNNIQKNTTENSYIKPIATNTQSQSNSIMDSVKQGFGFGVGSEIARKGVDAITKSIANNEKVVDMNCDNLQEEYIQCIKEYHMIHFCEDKYKMYEQCKKKYIQ